MAVNKLLGKVLIIILSFSLILGLASCQGQGSYYISELGIRENIRAQLLEDMVIIKVHYRVDFNMPSGEKETYEIDEYFPGIGFGKYILTLRSNLDVGGQFFIIPVEDVKIYYRDHELKDAFYSNLELFASNLALLELPEGVQVTTFQIGDFSTIEEGDKLIIPTGIFLDGEDPIKGIFPQSLAAKSFPLYSDHEFLIYAGTYDGTGGAPILAVTKTRNVELIGMVTDASFTGLSINDIVKTIFQTTGIDLRK